MHHAPQTEDRSCGSCWPLLLHNERLWDEQKVVALQDGGMAVRAGMQESRQSPEELQAIMAQARVPPQHTPAAEHTNGRCLDVPYRLRQAETAAAYAVGQHAWQAQSGSGVMQ